jgi:hypothetical protein
VLRARYRGDQLCTFGVISTASDTEIKQRIASQIATGALPTAAPTQATTFPGSGYPCAACSETIQDADVECLCDVPAHPLLRLHMACFTEWRRQQEN